MEFLGYFLELRPERYTFCSTEAFAQLDDDHGMRVYEAVSRPYEGNHTIIVHRYGKPIYLGAKVYEPARPHAKPSRRS